MKRRRSLSLPPTVLTVWCAGEGCNATVDLHATNKRQGAKEARALGWVESRQDGWLCPECAAAQERPTE